MSKLWFQAKVRTFRCAWAAGLVLDNFFAALEIPFHELEGDLIETSSLDIASHALCTHRSRCYVSSRKSSTTLNNNTGNGAYVSVAIWNASVPRRNYGSEFSQPYLLWNSRHWWVFCLKFWVKSSALEGHFSRSARQNLRSQIDIKNYNSVNSYWFKLNRVLSRQMKSGSFPFL